MARLQDSETGFSAIEAVLLVIIVAIIGFVGWYIYNANTKTDSTYSSANVTSNQIAKFKSTKSKSNTATAHTPQEAVSFTQTTYDTYLAALDKANSDPSNKQPVAQVGLAAVKNDLTPALYAKAAAVTQATPFSCTAQYVTDKYTASLGTSTAGTATVDVSISNGSGLSTNGMAVTVDLTSLKITAVKCPS